MHAYCPLCSELSVKDEHCQPIQKEGTMKRVIRKGLLLLMLLVALHLIVGATAVMADCSRWHVVRPGETLFAIGRLYSVNPYTIAQVNGLSNPNYIRIGQVLCIPSSSGWTSPPPQPYYPPTPCWYYYRCWPYYYPCYWWNWCWWDP